MSFALLLVACVVAMVTAAPGPFLGLFEPQQAYNGYPQNGGIAQDIASVFHGLSGGILR
uniref:Glycine-rich peptide n=1 Tax=Scytodes thoracica TaxID=1112478 RepID=A0A0A0V9Y2_SCYTH|nr:glycine-rich peptide [Scytodes thoracica]